MSVPSGGGVGSLRSSTMRLTAVMAMVSAGHPVCSLSTTLGLHEWNVMLRPGGSSRRGWAYILQERVKIEGDPHLGRGEVYSAGSQAFLVTTYVNYNLHGLYLYDIRVRSRQRRTRHIVCELEKLVMPLGISLLTLHYAWGWHERRRVPTVEASFRLGL